MKKSDLPIGYWLKEADKSITAKVNKNLEKYSLTRFHWQVLNTVYEYDEISKAALLSLLDNFLDETYLSEIIQFFVTKKWMNTVENSSADKSLIRMSSEGRLAFTEIFASQQQTRMQLFQGITEEEYEITVKVLKQVIENARVD